MIVFCHKTDGSRYWQYSLHHRGVCHALTGGAAMFGVCVYWPASHEWREALLEGHSQGVTEKRLQYVDFMYCLEFGGCVMASQQVAHLAVSRGSFDPET